MIACPSPNFEPRRECTAPRYVVLHYTGMRDGEAALARLCDPLSKVSAHYLVEEDGRIFSLVDEKYRAWHAGKSYWRGITDMNSHSIGIEIVNPGHDFGYRPFPDQQMEAVCTLCQGIKARYTLPADAFIAHSDIAPERKEDPGELFEWQFLAKKGIGLWPEVEQQDTVEMDVAEAKQCLSAIGYNATNATPVELGRIFRAFQRHFVPQHLSGELDPLTSSILRAVSRASGR